MPRKYSVTFRSIGDVGSIVPHWRLLMVHHLVDVIGQSDGQLHGSALAAVGAVHHVHPRGSRVDMRPLVVVQRCRQAQVIVVPAALFYEHEVAAAFPQAPDVVLIDAHISNLVERHGDESLLGTYQTGTPDPDGIGYKGYPTEFPCSQRRTGYDDPRCPA